MLLRRVVRENDSVTGRRGRCPDHGCCASASGQVDISVLELHADFQVTFLVHCLTVLINSEMTMSTHFRQGSLIFFTCFFTIVSKAMSGVNRPVLNTQDEGGGNKTEWEGDGGVGMGQGECHSITYKISEQPLTS